MNDTVEFFVHYEDARRMQPEWLTRGDPARDAVLWNSLSRMAKLNLRKAPCGLVLRTPEGKEILARQGSSRVTVTGEIGELVVFAFGRKLYNLEFDGDPTDVKKLRQTDYSV